MTWWTPGVALLLSVAAASPVAADEAPSSIALPIAVTERPLALPPTLCQATLVVESSLSVRRGLEPVSAAPDLHCGVTSRLTVGLVHSSRALGLVDSGRGLCLTGTDGRCQHVYDGTAVDALGLVRGGREALALRAGLLARSYDPFKPALRLGALARLRRGLFAFTADPHVTFGLASRDRGNRELLDIPLYAAAQLGPHISLALQTGLHGEIATLGDGHTIPVALEIQASPTASWDLGIQAGFPALLGPRNTARERHLAVFVTYRRAIDPRRPHAAWCTAD